MQTSDWNHRELTLWLAVQRAPEKLKRELREFWQTSGEFEIPAQIEKQLPELPRGLVERTYQWLHSDRKHFLLHCLDSEFPEALKEIYRAPILLFGIGDKTLLQYPLLAVIGSRKASPLALSLTEQMVVELCQQGWGIVSGMALGIDGLAHRTALAQGMPTIAVLGCGIDLVYPPRNRQLRNDIAAAGIVLSEYAPGTPAKTEHFPARNRIISGISLGVLVAEATLKSGSLITARYAVEQGREVFAIPGPVPHPGSEGCHLLIQQGAKLVTRSEDILAELPAQADLFAADKAIESRKAKPAEIAFKHEEPNKISNSGLTSGIAGKNSTKIPLNVLANERLLANVGFETTSFDWLLSQSEDSVSVVVNQLISLELDGWIKTVPGGYVRVRR
ncbi:DNA protecting protein DprA [Idiomarina sp. A28L]|uniref:DNA-processing protein DprA n=1 Tax=Idiomarina sp. A28L TaxID=1036674 RepID=UPI0002138C94|nr:DNA-processing protein DprA [Idiomarina sp. A28L]EGN76032.1 DNA protecting protein DprA [Idiomarina sp. A28L]